MAFLDWRGCVETMALFRHHARASQAIVLLSSHDLDLSLQFADSAWLLDGKGGMTTGPATTLIEAGEIGRAFDSRSVRISPELGRFELVTEDR